MYVLFDLDGCLANIDLRLQKAKIGGKMNWDIFFDPRNIQLDKPRPALAELYRMLMQDRNTIVMFTGRSDVTKQATLDWFQEHVIEPPHILQMRPDGNYKPDIVLKLEWLNKLYEKEGITKEDILFAIDDRQKMVDLWREQGITSLRC